LSPNSIDTDLSARPPLAPLPFARWMWQLMKDVINEYRRDGVGDLAASITFWTLLSIPAAILAVVSALGSVKNIVNTDAADDLETEITDYIDRTFADSQTLNDAVSELFASSSTGIVTVAAFVAVFSLSRGFAGLIRALDRAYEIRDGRAWWHVRIVAVFLGIGTVVVVAGSAVFLALLPELPGRSALQLLAGPAAFLLLVLWASTLFHIGPHHRTPWRYDLPGAVLTAIGWLVGIQGFAFYVRISEQGNQVQSVVGAVLLGLTLMYLLSNVMLVGAELNDVLSRRAGVVQQPVSYRERLSRARSRVDEVPSDLDDPAEQHETDTAVETMTADTVSDRPQTTEPGQNG
jgi:membrane protein